MKKNLLLFSIIILASFLRFWQLDNNPPGLHADEALTGYTAYSLLKTGLDLHGKFYFFSLSDTNIGGTYPPLYTYVLFPFVKFFGLSVSIDRIPSALFGIGTVIATFFVVKKTTISTRVALVSAFLLAVNPWAIHISRQGLLEAISLFLIMTGVLFFLYARSYSFWILSALAFGLSLYAYDAPRLFLLTLVIALIFYKKNTIFNTKKYLITFISVLFIFYTFLGWQIFFQGELQEYGRSNLLDTQRISNAVNRERYLSRAPLWFSGIFHNKITVSIKEIGTNYFSIFSVNWFFLNGSGNLQHAVGRQGAFYFFEFPAFFLGIYLLLKKSKKLAFFLLGWMFFGALPAGLSTGNHVYRAVHMLPIPIIFSSIGLVWIFQKIQSLRKTYSFLAITGFLLTVFIYVSSYIFTYFFDYPVYAADWWAKQQNEVLVYAANNREVYDNIFIDGGEDWFTMYAFLQKLDPKKYHKSYAKQKLFKDTKVIVIDNIYFGNFNAQLNPFGASIGYFPINSLVITNGDNAKDIEPLKKFYSPEGVEVVFKAIEVR